MRLKSVILALGAVLLAQQAAAEPVKIRLAYVVAVSNWATLLFEKPGLARHLDQSYSFEAIHFQGTPEMISAQAINALDIGDHGFSSFANGVLNAGIDDFRIIGDEFEDGVPGYYSDEFLVLKDSPIQSVEDLKGKVLADNLAGSALDIPLRAMLRRHKLDDKRDVTIINTPIPTLTAVLMDKKVALVGVPLPFSIDPKVRAATRTLFTQHDAVGITDMGFWVARKPFIDKNRAALVDFLEDALRAERWYLDPKNHAEVVEIAVRVSKAPAGLWQSWLFEKNGQDGDYFRPLDGKPNLQALQANIDLQHEVGFTKSSFDVRKYADLSLIEEAAARLK